ncbi:MAG: serine O-acetyltransferase, partial [Sulfurimonas sp.]
KENGDILDEDIKLEHIYESFLKAMKN